MLIIHRSQLPVLLLKEIGFLLILSDRFHQRQTKRSILILDKIYIYPKLIMHSLQFYLQFPYQILQLTSLLLPSSSLLNFTFNLLLIGLSDSIVLLGYYFVLVYQDFDLVFIYFDHFFEVYFIFLGRADF